MITASLFANDLSIDRRSIRAGESLTITVSLEDDFAALDEVHVPVRNLTLEARPSVESAFTWINATMMRRKVFRFRARAQTAGVATIGPVTLIAPNGRRETLQPLSLQVLPDRAAGSNEPSVVLRELLASGRDQFFVVAEVDKTSAFVGEQIVVTWWLFNAASVQQWQIGAIPKLDTFWIEELDVRSAQPYQVFVGDYAMQKVPIRRVALFPLRSGTLDIGSIEVEAAIMHRTSSGIFGSYEGNLVEISFASAPLKIDVKPLPPAGAGVSAIGDFSLRCTDPLQKNGGPVTMDAVLSGRGNVRAASAPRFASAPAGDVQMVEGGVNVDKGRSTPVMTRRWKYIIFPATSGTLRIPRVEMPIFDPSTATRQILRCEATMLAVDAAHAERTASVKGGSGSPRRISWQQAAAGAALAMAAVVVVIPLRRRFAVRREVRRLIGERSPAEIRDAVHTRLEERGVDPVVLMRESSDRGEAYRSLRSLLDALERDRIEVRDPHKEVRRRLRDLLVA